MPYRLAQIEMSSALSSHIECDVPIIDFIIMCWSVAYDEAVLTSRCIFCDFQLSYMKYCVSG